MADSQELILQLRPTAGEDASELSTAAGWLRTELLDLGVQNVSLLPDQDVPSGAKGIAVAAGWLWVQLGPEAMRAVLDKLADWVTRNDRGDRGQLRRGHAEAGPGHSASSRRRSSMTGSPGHPAGS